MAPLRATKDLDNNLLLPDEAQRTAMHSICSGWYDDLLAVQAKKTNRCFTNRFVASKKV